MDGCLSCCNGINVVGCFYFVVGCYMYNCLARLCTAWLVGYPKAVRPLLLMTCDIKG